ncbi:sodium:calcium antiporter [Phenylobacterium soli]|uniref:Sodium:calcium antiporter n=1 Tax=Phenylobacterium soli TaxID=2170551 RepID=A0A328APW4_9CAUL|nr:sodium:calcium antiporter [Phenylobacterium soli]RAK54908.1 sodium:calcium antiporter [Phenylobacterium soli]
MNPLLVNVVLLLGSAAVIYFACEFFVNGVEWLGRKLSVGRTATGTILAAFGTALPESVVTFVAVAFGKGDAQRELGVGAALGGPLVLATIAYATVGATLILSGRHLRRTGDVRKQFQRLSRDQGWFLTIFIVKLSVGLVAFAFKPWLGVLFLAAYAIYFWREMSRDESDEAEEHLEPLIIARKRQGEPPLSLSALQTAVALVVIFGASRLFVSQLDALGPALGMKPQLLALLLSPIATELPETMNAIIWVRQGKHRLALANISGAMMIQATVPTAFGLFWTPWLLDRSLILAGGVTAIAVAVMFVSFRRGVISRGFLASMGLFYALFAALLVLLHL